MSTVQPSKRVAVSCSPLHDPSILRTIFSYVGPGHWLFLSTVSSLWRELYSALASLYIPRAGFFDNDITCVPKMTLYSSVFASASRVRLAHDCSLDNSTRYYLYAAGVHADIATLVTVHELGAPWSANMVCGVAFGGSVFKLEWLHTQQHCQLPADISKHAAKGGSIEVLMWSKQQRISFSKESCAAAADCNQLVALQFLHAEGCALDAALCNVAARTESLDVLRWLIQQGVGSITKLYNDAIFRDHLTILQLLHSEGFVLTADMVADSITSYGIDVLMWLREQGLPMTAEACEAVTFHNRLDLLQSLHADGCPWTESVCSTAAERGYFEVLRWAHEHGCPWDAETIVSDAAKSGDQAVVAWVKQQPGVLFDHNCMISAAEHGDMAMCQYLLKEGCT
jgi:hypothetical protein